MEQKNYYLGLDIGTDSVGYAATDEQYCLKKFRGEPVWGSTTFEAATLSQERRSMRTARRRLDRRQQRVKLIEEIFAPEVCRIDPQFFIRRQESALFAEDRTSAVKLFDGGITDREYHQLYPTIHHLIQELMRSSAPHDVRLVYIACAWLVAHRGHFLFGADENSVMDFGQTYADLRDHLYTERECSLPWDTSVSADTIAQIMQTPVGVRRKQAMFTEQVYGGKKPPKKADDSFPFSREAIVALLSGGTAKPKDIFQNPEYAEVDALSLTKDEEDFFRILLDLGEDAELLRKLRAMYDCALLSQTLNGHNCISDAKVELYDTHKQDLAYLKQFVRQYIPAEFDTIFRTVQDGNYVAYSGYVKPCADQQPVKRANREVFCDYLKKKLKDIPVEEGDREAYDSMMERLQNYSFLPKQRNSDNRIIPQQLYYAELKAVLEHASAYLPMLSRKDENGLTNAEKILSVFRFRIPYYVGPLNQASEKSWVVRKAGKIYPWNFSDMVDLDASEEAFINRMTNTCTYLPGEKVLPRHSLLYSRFTLLNELNNLTINHQSIPVAVKQELVTELFCKSGRKITRTKIADYLKSHGYLNPDDELGGIDTTVNASLKSYQSFRRLLEAGTLSEDDVEEIIRHAAYSEDKNRMNRWLNQNYPQLSEDDRRYVLNLKLKDFGRLSAHFLTGLYHVDPETGEALNIMDMLWRTNENLMQLLSDRYSFQKQHKDFSANYYAEHPKSLSDRLDDMYISNAVKRPIIRALKITEEVTKAMGCPPKKIFVEMARDSDNRNAGKRTASRRQQILDLYKTIKTDDARALEAELLAMGDLAENRLQGDKLFLYYMQLGRCMYTGAPIELSQLATGTYNIDHIYPQSKIPDDSILNNKVLCLSTANETKGDRYPIDAPIREARRSQWEYLLRNHLITEEKFKRLTRSTKLTDEELHQFINRQLTETRQASKAVTQLLSEFYPKPETEIVYVKAGLVSRFRDTFGLQKSRAVNDLHHAKDAYLNIVVGNVYHERFTRRWFNVNQEYTLKTKSLFGYSVTVGDKTIWRGSADIALVKKTMAKNAVHLTRYSFCRKGGLFDQQPKEAGSGLIPRKADLPTEKYGGYNKTTVSFYMLASYTLKGKKDIIFVPIELMYADRVMTDEVFAAEYIATTISGINGGKPVENVQLLLGGRQIKINTVIEADGMRLVLKSKNDRGKQIVVSPCTPLILGTTMERYVKRLESFRNKKKTGSAIRPDAEHDHITPEENLALYDTLCTKLTDSVFAKCPGNIVKIVAAGRCRFTTLKVEEQITCLLDIIAWFGSAPKCDLKCIGGSGQSGTKRPNAHLTSWANRYSDVRIVDTSAAGLHESRSENLLALL